MSRNEQSISRRDFVNGIAISAIAGSSMTPFELFAATPAGQVYPPALTGLRGSHVGSFETAHAVSWGGEKFSRPRTQTDGLYDLIVVGGGLSGLAAAFYYRQRAGDGKKILILDNHDDFGGHAKRNEFTVAGKDLVGYGGSQSVESPGKYSKAARQLLRDVGIDVERFYEYFDRKFFADRELRKGLYFSAEKYGRDVTTQHFFEAYEANGQLNLDDIVGSYPIDAEARRALVEIVDGNVDYFSGLGDSARKQRLQGMSYRDFLLDVIAVPEPVYHLLADSHLGTWGVGWDALSALEAYRLEMPGTYGLQIDEPLTYGEDAEPYIFHFPDGNAAIARSIVRHLIPNAVPGKSIEDRVTSRIDYHALDENCAATRIRLNSTAVDVRHTADQRAVDIVYVRGGETFRVRGKHAVMAGNNSMLPFICSEMPSAQSEAIAYAVRIPLAYINIAVRNWNAFANLGLRDVFIPQARLMHSFGMDFPVSLGGYQYTSEPSQPTVLHGSYVPRSADRDLSARQQHERGRQELYEKSFAELELDIVAQVQGALATGGFDAERDIVALTVNRWPHGYAYEYNDLNDPADWGPGKGPHIRGRAKMGRVSIANSDASAYAYVNGAFDAADRAVNEQLDRAR